MNGSINLSDCRRRTAREDFLKKSDLTTKATYDHRKLTSLDLAFFGRLLVSLNAVTEIPGFTPPPFPFPDDFSIDFS